jgi:hypothetical protein
MAMKLVRTGTDRSISRIDVGATDRAFIAKIVLQALRLDSARIAGVGR